MTWFFESVDGEWNAAWVISISRQRKNEREEEEEEEEEEGVASFFRLYQMGE